MNIAERLSRLRQVKAVYLKELAVHLKISIGTMSNYERGIHQPSLDTLCQLADYYGTTTDYLLGRISHPVPPKCDSPKTETKNMQLREKIFFDTDGLSDNNLQALELIIKTLKHYEVHVEEKAEEKKAKLPEPSLTRISDASASPVSGTDSRPYRSKNEENFKN